MYRDDVVIVYLFVCIVERCCCVVYLLRCIVERGLLLLCICSIHGPVSERRFSGNS